MWFNNENSFFMTKGASASVSLDNETRSVIQQAEQHTSAWRCLSKVGPLGGFCCLPNEKGKEFMGAPKLAQSEASIRFNAFRFSQGCY